MGKRTPWYNQDDVVVDPRIASEAGRYAKLAMKFAAEARHKREHTCPHCKGYFAAIKMHMEKSACGRRAKKRAATRERKKSEGKSLVVTAQPDRLATLGKPARGTLAWAISSGQFKK